MNLQMEEMRQILVANNLKLPANRVNEASFEVREVECGVVARGDSKGKKACSRHNEVESQGDSCERYGQKGNSKLF